jgi:uncharacterized protein
MTPDTGVALLQEFKRRAEAALAGRVSRVVLFGSRARGNAAPGSDWDIAVFLTDAASSWDTIALADAAYDLILNSGQFIQPIALSEREPPINRPLIDNIERDGIAI